MKLIECVPNFSEGRRPEVVAAIRDAIAAVPSVVVLDVSSDPSHNRTVVTFVAGAEHAVAAAFAGIAKARDLIDLNHHQGEHPRLGATDVVPFIPLEGATMDDCIALARALGEKVGAELGIPVFLYERAATRPDRENLADIRRGEFEAARTEIGANPAKLPDFGPNHIHATAGATVIGARPFLVAFNVYLGDASNLPVAKEVAKAVRGSSGGLRYVKGLGLEVDGQAQVSMNLVDTDKTPLHRAFDLVKMEAEARGVSPTWSELVGLVPEKALFDAAARHLQLTKFTTAQVLDRKVREAVRGGTSVSAFLGEIAGPAPVPGGGSVSAHAGALAAALSQMVAGLTIGRKKYAAVEPEMKALAIRAAALVTRCSALVQQDADAYLGVSSAYKIPREGPGSDSRDAKIADALIEAARVPLETAQACAEAAELAAVVAQDGNSNAVSDAGVAALLAEAGARGAAYHVRINVASLPNDPRSAPLTAAVEKALARATAASQAARDVVERTIASMSS